MKTDVSSTILNRFEGAEMIQEFPVIFRCALQCDFYESTGDDILELRKMFNSIGMAQLFKKKEGFFIIFVGSSGAYFCTNTGSFQIESGFLSLRCESGLFIFEISVKHSEEAKCAVLDLISMVERVKARKQRIQQFVELRNWFEDIFNSDDDETEDDSDE